MQTSGAPPTDLQQLALVAVVLAPDQQLVDARAVRHLHQDEGEAAVRVDLGGRGSMSGQDTVQSNQSLIGCANIQLNSRAQDAPTRKSKRCVTGG